MDEHVISHAFHHNAFLIVSNGHRARYGSITSQWEHFAEWKRLDESEMGDLDAKILLNGMLEKNRLLDIVENFILFDESKAGPMRTIVARNHQVLGVNQAVVSVERREQLKLSVPPQLRLSYKIIELPAEQAANINGLPQKVPGKSRALTLPESAHPDLGKLGVVWHTQGSGKSYSMAFFAEKVRRQLEGNFTFLLMTDREDLDSQIYGTFVGCGLADDRKPRATSGRALEQLLKENHRYVFSLIHKFNQEVKPGKPYSLRDDIIVISDEAHRTQAGKLARNMRLALPNAAFLGFTGTPLFSYDELTRRIFGDYVSRYDFKRSEEDGSTVKLVYENRGDKLGIAKPDLNERISKAIENAELNADQEGLLERLMGKDYKVITADKRLDRLAADFVEHCTTRWESGKSMLVCIDKITCARMHQRIMPHWAKKLANVRTEIDLKTAALANTDEETRQRLYAQRDRLKEQALWMEETRIAIVISEAQNEVAAFKKWDFDIVPHRALLKQGFETADGKRVDVEQAFKNPEHPFRVAIVCAMWLTGFDVECLSTLYLDKPMRAHNLMQAIARANRCYPGKDFGLIVDYNGMLKSLREALAKYALGDQGNGDDEIVAPIEERVKSLLQSIEATETHLLGLGFDVARLAGAKGFDRIEALADAVEAIHGPNKEKSKGGEDGPDETKRRFEILARQVFIRFKALLMEPAASVFGERHDNIEAIYKKLAERRDTADVTELLKELHRIVNLAIQTQTSKVAEQDVRYFDLSKIDLEKLRDELTKKFKRKATIVQDIRDVLETKLAQMLALNPGRMDYQKRYEEIISEYNSDKDKASIEIIFAQLLDLEKSLDEEQRRAAKESLSEEELAIFDLLRTEHLGKSDREKVKSASKGLLASLQALLPSIDHFTEKEQTQAEVKTTIRDFLHEQLPDSSFSIQDKEEMVDKVYGFVWQQSASDIFVLAATH